MRKIIYMYIYTYKYSDVKANLKNENDISYGFMVYIILHNSHQRLKYLV